jgi:hypothetical protein
MTTEVSSSLPVYPQAKLRIQASYHAGQDGETVPPGQPESVDIEINEPYGDGAEAIAFITALVDSLFRLPERRQQYEYNVTVDDGTLITRTGAGVQA